MFNEGEVPVGASLTLAAGFDGKWLLVSAAVMRSTSVLTSGLFWRVRGGGSWCRRSRKAAVGFDSGATNAAVVSGRRGLLALVLGRHVPSGSVLGDCASQIVRRSSH